MKFNNYLINNIKGHFLVFVPGFLSRNADHKSVIKKLATYFNNLEYYEYTWDSSLDWFTARDRAREEAPKLANYMETFSDQNKVSLIGHSLGASIILGCLYLLSTRKLKVEQVILLGAAVDNDDPVICSACSAVSDFMFNFYSKDDLILRDLYTKAELAAPLGFKGLSKTPPKNYIDVDIEPYMPFSVSSLIRSFGSEAKDPVPVIGPYADLAADLMDSLFFNQTCLGHSAANVYLDCLLRMKHMK